MIRDAAPVLDRLARIPAAAFVRRLPVRRLHEAAPVVLVVRGRRPSVALVRLLELRTRRTRIRDRRVSGGGGRRARGHIHADEPFRVIQVRQDAVVVPEFALDLLRHAVRGGRVHLETTTFVNMLCITSFDLHKAVCAVSAKLIAEVL